MRSAEFLDHFEHPRNAGELPPPAVTVEVANPVCGDTLRLSVEWVDGRISQAAFRCRGCAAAVAAASALTELLKGLSRQEAAALNASAIERALGGLPPESGHAAVLCRDAVRMLLK